MIATRNNTSSNGFNIFSARKFNDLKREHPQWSESRIEKAVKQEWEILQTTNGKAALSASQNRNNIAPILNERSSRKQDTVSKKLDYSKVTPIKKENKNESEQSIEIEKSQSQHFMKKTKKINKNPSKNEYLKFFKFYQDKLHSQHPKWAHPQIQNIIILLWRKKQCAEKKKKKQIIPKRRQSMSARAFFGLEKRKLGFNNDEINKMWRCLPEESKKYWGQLGFIPKEQKNQTQQKKEVKVNVNVNPLSFMNKIM